MAVEATVSWADAPIQFEQFDLRFKPLFKHHLFRRDPGFEEMPPGADVSGGDFRFRGCAGPVWCPELDALAFNDVGHGRVLTWTPGGEVLALRQGAMQAGMARDRQGRFIACEVANGRVIRLEPNGTITLVAERIDGKRLAAPDAVVVGPDGAIWFTDPQRPFPPRAALGTDLIESGGVYRVSPDLSTVERITCPGVTTPGGLALSADGRKLHVTCEQARQVFAYPVLDGARLGDARPFRTMFGEEKSTAYGLCLDREDYVYVGGPRGVWVFAPDGAALGVIHVPGSWITGLAFGGAEGDVLFVLTSTGVGALQMATGVGPIGAPTILPSRGEPIAYRQHVERIDPALDAVIAPDARIRNIACGGFLADLGGGPTERFGRSLEGTFWDSERRCLLFSDEANDRRLRYDPATNEISVALEPTGFTNGTTLDVEGRVIQAEQGPGRCISRIEHDGTRTVLVDRFEGKRLNRPNDVVVRSDGSVFFTNPWWTFGDGDGQEMEGGSVLHLWPDENTVSLIADDFQVPNGIAFSPDERTLFINESQGTDCDGKHIRAYDVREDGSIDAASARVWARFPAETLDAPGSPDGMKVDQAGNLYCGGPGGLWIFDPSGMHLGTIVHGDAQTNNLCFGGEDWRTLYFVSWVGLHAIDVLVPGVPLPAVRPDVG